MADQYVQVAPDSTGKKIDNTELTVNTQTVQRQRINVSGSAAAALAEVLNSAPSTEYGLITRNIPSGTQTVSGTVTASNAAGDVAHDSANSGNPVQVGAEAIAHGTNPTAVTAADRTKLYANRHGIPFVIGGHMNSITASARITGSSTDGALTPTVNTGTKLVITRLSVTLSNANSVNVGVKLGFSDTTLPADSTTGAAGVLIDNDGFPPGGGVNIGSGDGIIGIGGDGQELRITNDAPTSGALHVSYTYYTIES